MQVNFDDVSADEVDNFDYTEESIDAACEQYVAEMHRLAEVTRFSRNMQIEHTVFRPTAMKRIEKEQLRQKTGNDKKRKVVDLKVGDLVLKANKHRIAGRRGYKDLDNWSDPHRIAAVTNTTAILEGTKHRVNRHYLKKFKGLPLALIPVLPKPKSTRNRKRKPKSKSPVQQQSRAIEDEEAIDGDQQVYAAPDTEGVWLQRFGYKILNSSHRMLLTAGSEVDDTIVNMAMRMISESTDVPEHQVSNILPASRALKLFLT
jgi:hypothetical protein